MDYDEHRGPLVSSNIYPFYLPFINLAPDRAKPLGEGNFKITVSNLYGNTFNYDVNGVKDGFQFDMDVEHTRTMFGFDIGITPFLDLGVEAAYVVMYGGIFDPVIQGFHNLFGFPNGGRDNVEDNQFNITIANEKGLWINLQEAVSGINDITLKAKLNLYRSKERGLYLALQPAVKIPVGDTDQLLSNGNMDIAVNILAEKNGYNYAAYINAGWMHVAAPENLQIFDFSTDLFSFMLSYEWLVRGGWSAYFQVDGNTSPYISSHKRLDHFTASINLGCKFDLFGNSRLQVSFGEEFFTFATTDIYLNIAMELIF
ncbi:MAG: DUF3187 family protein [Acidobacteria bacterium]|nr:DUF3187 family protein [Acidobacteriota bacterium]